MSLWEKLERIDRRVLYVLLWIVVLPVLYYPVNLPTVLSSLTQQYYNQIEAIPSGSIVVLAFDLGPEGWPELGGMCYASMQHLFTKIAEGTGIKVVMLTYWSTGATLIPNCFNEVYGPMDKMGAVYGTDWVNLGWIAGGEVGMSAFAADVWGAKPTDYQGTLVNTIPLMQNVRTIQDIYMLVTIESGTPGLPEYLRQWWSRKNTLKILVGALGVSIPGVEPYRPAQVQSYLPGGKGASEYISLLGKDPDVGPAILAGEMGKIAVGVNDGLSTSHILVIIFVAIGNIGYFLRPRRK